MNKSVIGMSIQKKVICTPYNNSFDVWEALLDEKQDGCRISSTRFLAVIR